MISNRFHLSCNVETSDGITLPIRTVHDENTSCCDTVGDMSFESETVCSNADLFDDDDDDEMTGNGRR